MATWAGTWKRPGRFPAGRSRLASQFTTPQEVPPAPAQPRRCGRCSQDQQRGPGLPPAAPGRTWGSHGGRAGRLAGSCRRGQQRLGVVGEKQIYKPASPRSFAAGGSSSPPRSGRAAAGGCQHPRRLPPRRRPRPLPEAGGGLGPAGREAPLRSAPQVCGTARPGPAADPSPAAAPVAPAPTSARGGTAGVTRRSPQRRPP